MYIIIYIFVQECFLLAYSRESCPAHQTFLASQWGLNGAINWASMMRQILGEGGRGLMVLESPVGMHRCRREIWPGRGCEGEGDGGGVEGRYFHDENAVFERAFFAASDDASKTPEQTPPDEPFSPSAEEVRMRSVHPRMLQNSQCVS